MRIYPETTKQEVRSFRRNGLSLGEISQKIKIPKNTLIHSTMESSLIGENTLKVNMNPLLPRNFLTECS